MFNHKQLYSASPLWARQVRLLALDSHQLINNAADEPHPIQVELMLARIDDLRAELQKIRHAPLLRWLDMLREKVEACIDSLDNSSVITV